MSTQKSNQGFQKGHIDFTKNKGRKRSIETLKKMRKSSLLKWQNQEYRKHMVEVHKGKKPSIETKRKMSESQKKVKHWWDVSGENNGRWKGGVTKIDKLIRRMKEYFQWRSDIFMRDNWTCKTCNKNGCYITVHHIKSVSKIIKENEIKNIKEARNCVELWDINNGITLCEDCHELTDNYKGKAKNK